MTEINETELPHSDIPYLTGDDGLCVHQTEGGFLSIEFNDAKEIANVTRRLLVDETCLFNGHGVAWISHGLTEQQMSEFPGLIVDTDGWRTHHADKRLNGQTFCLHDPRNDTYLSLEDGEAKWIEVSRSQFDLLEIPLSCALSREERDFYAATAHPDVKVIDYSDFELEIFPMKVDEEDNETNAEEDTPEWYEVSAKVTYNTSIMPPNAQKAHDIIFESEKLTDDAEIRHALGTVCSHFSCFGSPLDWAEEYIYNLPVPNAPRP
jgi:hypothetical protein